MSFDNSTRNRLASFVAECRNLLSEEFTGQLKRDYGLDPDSGVVTDLEKLTQLNDAGLETARILRDTLEHYVAVSTSEPKKAREEAMQRIVREQAFTVLNRLCALRMAESRKLFVESVGNGMLSQGFQLYSRLAGTALGESGDAYRCYLFSVFDELAVDLAVLFNRFSPEGRLFPSESVLQEILDRLNAPEVVVLWAEDETIGWIYQYFNDPAERKKMRDESSAPRNSRELAVRNQFFTPRYVVEFLTDNTLGRIWYEMTQGQTSLKDSCRYMVRRPDEVFLSEAAHEPADENKSSLGIPARDATPPSAARKTEAQTGRNAHPTVSVADLLLTGTQETFPEFSAEDDQHVQAMIDFAHCVDGYVRRPNEEQSAEWYQEFFQQHLQPMQYDGTTTQDLLDALFLTCRIDRHGGDGSVYKERWFAATSNEVRRRVLNSRRSDLTQEELLKQPVFIPYRAIKDPREIRMLDPACGSMHFGLYAFDLFEVIYNESRMGIPARRSPDGSEETDGQECPSYIEQSQIPKLIIEHNIHGIDIDPRAAQIAGLSLWLRAQKSWQQQKVKPQHRPAIKKSNIVCAEPMPGNSELLEEFLKEELSKDAEEQLLAVLVRKVFEAMKLAGEAGSLLKIEEEIAGEIESAREIWNKSREKKQQSLFAAGPKQVQKEMDFVRKIDDATFWAEAEQRIYDALAAYAEHAENGGGFQRRLFAADAAQGFAFIDLCRKRYDVAVMNPPFGDASLPSKGYIDETYGDTKGDVYKAFVECFHARLVPAGYLGIISSRTGFFLGQSEDWRTRVVLRLFRPIALADLGMGVLDAMVEVAAYVLRSLSKLEARDLILSLVPVLGKVARDRQDCFSLPKWQAARDGLKRHQAVAELEHLAAHGIVQRCLGEIVRYTPLRHSVMNDGAPPDPAFPPLICIRALLEHDKGAALVEAVSGATNGKTFVCDPAGFLEMSSSVFAYWIPEKIRQLFRHGPRFETATRTVKQGLATADDFRFVRLSWEPRPDPNRPQWYPFAKGGAFSPYYADLRLEVNWLGSGREMKAWAETLPGCSHWSRRVASTEYYFRPGLTWPRRTNGLSFRILPKRSIFADKGPGGFCEGDNTTELLATTAVFNSSVFGYLVQAQLARVSLAQSFEVGMIQNTPFPPISSGQQATLANLATRAWNAKRLPETTVGVSHAFILPALLAVHGTTIAERAAAWAARVRTSEESVAAIQAEIDALAVRLYGLDAGDRAALTAPIATEATGDAEFHASEDEQSEAPSEHTSVLAAELLSYAFGTAFGRWDVQYSTGDRSAAAWPDPFAPLPVCSPGMLQGDDGRPLTKADSEKLKAEKYPIEIPWDGILVDDPQHAFDIERHVQAVLAIIWKERADAIESEACEILGVRTLRDWFQRPASFFADHLKRYSKSRRQAPIYWPLSTESGGYTLWIYYHRLTDQTLYHAVNNFVEPKLKQASEDVTRLKGKSSRSSAEEKDLSQLTVLESELTDFCDELLRIAKFWKPNLNDGVLITASPLWKLFRLPKWRKDLKACWEELEKGKYDWAHLALSIWPDRVVRTAHKDRSIAIAHDLETDLWHEVTVTKTGKGKNPRTTTKTEWQPKKLSEAELEKIAKRKT